MRRGAAAAERVGLTEQALQHRAAFGLWHYPYSLDATIDINAAPQEARRG